MPSASPAKTVSAPSKILLGVALAALLAGIWYFGIRSNSKEVADQPATCAPAQQLETAPLQVDGREFTAELASTPEQKYRGLSGRECLNEDTLMLFSYGVAGDYCYVMRDMKFAIDMIWLDDDKKIVTIKRDAQPESYPDEIFCPQRPAQYVVEAQAGTAARLGWQNGTQFSF